jgi:hypothetical protein
MLIYLSDDFDLSVLCGCEDIILRGKRELRALDEWVLRTMNVEWVLRTMNGEWVLRTMNG